MGSYQNINNYIHEADIIARNDPSAAVGNSLFLGVFITLIPKV